MHCGCKIPEVCSEFYKMKSRNEYSILAFKALDFRKFTYYKTFYFHIMAYYLGRKYGYSDTVSVNSVQYSVSFT